MEVTSHRTGPTIALYKRNLFFFSVMVRGRCFYEVLVCVAILSCLFFVQSVAVRNSEKPVGNLFNGRSSTVSVETQVRPVFHCAAM